MPDAPTKRTAAERQRRHRVESVARARGATVAAGGPIYAPAGRAFSRWRVVHDGTGGSVLMEAANVRRRRWLRVRTFFSKSNFVAEPIVVSDLLREPDLVDQTLPFTLQVHRREQAVAVDDGDPVVLTIFSCNDLWTAFGDVDDRSLEIRSWGVPFDEVRLLRIDDVAAMPDWRWPEVSDPDRTDDRATGDNP